MAKLSKRIQNMKEQFEKDKIYDPKEALGLIKKLSKVKFDETVEVAFRLNVDPRQADQNIRGAMVLPNGTGKTRTVAVVCKGDKQNEAKEANADFVGDADLIEKIEKGWFDFDVLISTPDMMAQLGKLGRVLGPKGLMPNPKTGTVTFDIKKAVEEVKAGKIEYRVDKVGNIHVPIGKVSFDEKKLLENYMAIFDVITKARPSSTKGIYIKNISISSTMGVGIKVNTQLEK